MFFRPFVFFPLKKNNAFRLSSLSLSFSFAKDGKPTIKTSKNHVPRGSTRKRTSRRSPQRRIPRRGRAREGTTPATPPPGAISVPMPSKRWGKKFFPPGLALSLSSPCSLLRLTGWKEEETVTMKLELRMLQIRIRFSSSPRASPPWMEVQRKRKSERRKCQKKSRPLLLKKKTQQKKSGCKRTNEKKASPSLNCLQPQEKGGEREHRRRRRIRLFFSFCLLCQRQGPSSAQQASIS